MLKFAIRTLKICAFIVLILSVVVGCFTLLALLGEISRSGLGGGYMTNSSIQAIVQMVTVLFIGLITALQLYITAALMEMMIDIHKHTRTSANVLLKMYRDQSEPGSPSQKSVPFPDIDF